MTPEQEAAKKRVIESFRMYLAARGIRGYLLSDDEVWEWVERLVESMNRHCGMLKISREQAENFQKNLAKLVGAKRLSSVPSSDEAV